MANTSSAEKENTQIINALIKAWVVQVTKISEIVEVLADADLQREIAPNKNTGHYVLGHLVAVNDAMLPLLGFGNKLYPELEKPFIKSPDKSGQSFTSIGELRAYWTIVNDQLLQHFNRLTSEQWLGRHMSVSEVDFAKEPNRHKLSVLISRTTHLSYHLGQLVFLKPNGD